MEIILDTVSGLVMAPDEPLLIPDMTWSVHGEDVKGIYMEGLDQGVHDAAGEKKIASLISLDQSMFKLAHRLSHIKQSTLEPTWYE